MPSKEGLMVLTPDQLGGDGKTKEGKEEVS